MKVEDCTIVIAARNAAETIARAVKSAAPSPVLLIDDGSTDRTVDIARNTDPSIRVVKVPVSRGLGHARQYGLTAVETPYLVWLDADDEFLPGRVSTLRTALDAGADVVFDSAELFDGHTERHVRTLQVPFFLLQRGAIVRTFERNYLPGPAWPAIRTEFAQRIGYDPEQTTGDDVDFIYRALAVGGRLTAIKTTGYKQFAYTTSLSRNLVLQRAMLARALRKHSYADVRRLYSQAGYSARVTAWGLSSMALFREEPVAALDFLESASPMDADPHEILEPEGPLPLPEGWRRGFTRGTALCLLGCSDQALPAFESAARHSLSETSTIGGIRGAPDLLNNWGVALAKCGQTTTAHEKFSAALALFPSYTDAGENLAAPHRGRLTTHPLRRLPSRREY